MIWPFWGKGTSLAWMNSTRMLASVEELTLPVMMPVIVGAKVRKVLSLTLKYAQIGCTWETVVILVLVPTRSPICELDTPAIPSMGEYTLVQPRFNSAFFSFAWAATTDAFMAVWLARSLSSCFWGMAFCA